MHLLRLRYSEDDSARTVVLVDVVLLAVTTTATVLTVWRRVEIVTARLEVRLVAVMLTWRERIGTATWKFLMLNVRRGSKQPLCEVKLPPVTIPVSFQY